MKRCPLCKGKGFVKQTKKERTILSLRKKGLTIREIAKIVKMGSTTVFHHLKRKKKRL